MTSTTRPVMLLDLDGVLNALTNPIGIPGLPDSIRTVPKMLTRTWPEDSWRIGSATVDTVKFPLLWSTHVVKQLTAWHEDGEAEIRWHTTWHDDALWVARDVFKLPRFAVADCPEFFRNEGAVRADQMRDGLPGWWKYRTGQRVLTEEGRPLIWVDDDLNRQINHFHRDKMAKMGRFCPISTTSAVGLNPRQIRLINTFIQDCAEEGQP